MTPSTKTWLAAYLYYAEPWEKFLTETVSPFVEALFEKKLVEQFFFVRYWERGPHIRLRFKGEEQVLQEVVKPELNAVFLGYFEQHPSQRVDADWITSLPEGQRWFPNNSVQFIEYEPETGRYGGPTGILIAERQFEISSRTVLSILDEASEWSYDRALGAAIQLHLALAHSMRMDLYETTQFYSSVFRSWFSRAYGLEPDLPEEQIKERQSVVLMAFEEHFTEQKSLLVPYHQTLWNAFEEGVEFEQDWLNKWLHNMTRIGAELKQAQEKRELIFPEGVRPSPQTNIPEINQRLWYILGSCVHMTNNRLGILNRDEAYLGYLIKRSLEHLTEE